MDRDRVEAVESWKLLELTGFLPCVIANRALGSDRQTGYHGNVWVKGNCFRPKHILAVSSQLRKEGNPMTDSGHLDTVCEVQATALWVKTYSDRASPVLIHTV